MCSKISRVLWNFGYRDDELREMIQEIYCRFLKSGTGQTIMHAMINIHRQENGVRGTDAGKSKSSFRTAVKHAGQFEKLKHRLADKEQRRDLWWKVLEGEERIVCGLIAKWGLTNVEIAELMGLQKSAVSRRIGSARRKLNP